MGIFDVNTITNLMVIISRIYETIHVLVVAVSIVLIFGGFYAFFTQSRYNSGFLGLDHQKHGRGLGVSMFLAGVAISVFDTVITIFTWEFARESSPLESLSIDGTSDVIAGAGPDIFVLMVRLGGLYSMLLGVLFVLSGIIRASTAGSVQLSGSKILLYSLMAGIVLILIGQSATGYTGR
ncbi:MAG: hypothetical protein QM504_03420 [Pseudomonadota bacterium]